MFAICALAIITFLFFVGIALAALYQMSFVGFVRRNDWAGEMEDQYWARAQYHKLTHKTKSEILGVLGTAYFSFVLAPVGWLEMACRRPKPHKARAA